jgi:hypothetical protein
MSYPSSSSFLVVALSESEATDLCTVLSPGELGVEGRFLSSAEQGFAALRERD